MQTIRKPTAVARRLLGTSETLGHGVSSPEQGWSSASGPYRAVRRMAPPPAHARAVDDAKLEGLRFELDLGLWRGDSERIAQLVVDDATHLGDEAEPSAEE